MLGTLHDLARKALVDAGIGTPALDARILVQEAAGCSHADLIVRPQTPVAAEAAERLRQWVARRIAGEPVFRILGWREFYGLRLQLSGGVLEPRPDTEILVDHALPLLRAAADAAGHARLLDLGSGSGAIALALLAAESRAQATGIDISDDALATARRNAAENGLAERFQALRSNWFDEIAGRFDLIVANPPYVATQEIASLAPEVRQHDPVAALDGGPDGLAAFREIARRGLEFLAGNGHLLVEIGTGQHEDVIALFERHGFVFRDSRRDLQGSTRSLAFASP